MKICVIEPHADDAFLSCGYHLEKVWPSKGYETSIYTIFSGTRKRSADAVAFARTVKADWYGCGLTEGEPFDPLDVGVMAPLADIYVSPIGIQHPEHKTVRVAIERNIPSSQIWYYADTPYYAALKNADEFTDLIAGKLTPVSVVTPHANKFRHIPLFKDQSKFFHFNPKEKLQKIQEWIFEEVENV